MKTQRRNNLELNTPAEKAIFSAMQEVEKTGADTKLTEAVTLLSKAKDLVADYIDEDMPDYKGLISFDDCCKACGTTEAEFNAKFLNIGLSPDALNLERLGIINKAINGGWQPDRLDIDQKKWFPVFKVSSSGFGFSYSTCYDGCTDASVGSRLCFETEAQSDYSATQFLKFWKALITNTEE